MQKIDHRSIAYKAIFYHGSPGFEEPVEAELRRVADALAQLVVHTLLVEAQLVEHADEEAVLLLRVVFPLVGAIGDAELMERSLVATNLGGEKKETLIIISNQLLHLRL